MGKQITRRAVIAGALASTAALAVPAVAAAVPEHPWVKARRVARELSAVLPDLRDSGEYLCVSIVHPAGTPYPICFADVDMYAGVDPDAELVALAERWVATQIEVENDPRDYQDTGLDGALRDLESRISAIRPRTARGLSAKFLVLTSWANMGLDGPAESLIPDMMALAGIEPPIKGWAEAEEL